MRTDETWAYRARQQDALTPVQILKLGMARPPRVKVRFLDDAYEGREDWVPTARLKAPWQDRAAWLAEDAHWHSARAAYDGDKTLDDAVMLVFDYVISDWGVAEELGGRNRGLLFIDDVPALAQRLGLDPDWLTEHPAGFQTRGGTYVAPWPVTLLVARRAADLNADLLLDAMTRDVQRDDQEAIHGRYYAGRGGKPGDYVSPEICAETAKMWQAPRAVIREWCGAPAVVPADERVALRAEVARLRKLLQSAIVCLDAQGHPRDARRLARHLNAEV
jgi:hypothetical protein